MPFKHHDPTYGPGHPDFEDRKLRYINASAGAMSVEKRRKLADEYSDVVQHLEARPATSRSGRPVSPPQNGAEPAEAASLEDLIAEYGVADIVGACLANATMLDFEALTPMFAAAGERLGMDKAVNIISALLPTLTLDELNSVFEALPALIDAGGAKPDEGKGGAVESVLPADWKSLQWKTKVKLANQLGGNVTDVAGADAFLQAIADKEAAGG